jgi:hypothetical protein
MGAASFEADITGLRADGVGIETTGFEAVAFGLGGEWFRNGSSWL